MPIILVFHPPSILKVSPLSLDIISLDFLLMEVLVPQVAVTPVTQRERAAIQSHDVSNRRSWSHRGIKSLKTDGTEMHSSIKSLADVIFPCDETPPWTLHLPPGSLTRFIWQPMVVVCCNKQNLCCPVPLTMAACLSVVRYSLRNPSCRPEF